ncbi:MAG TPA: hypothetical protein VIF15_18635 [Polyangiaceae bacterium]|jgi:hypothetical protein
MTTPQQPRVRRKQKARRTKQLAEWRGKQPAKAEPAAKADKGAKPAKKTASK